MKFKINYFILFIFLKLHLFNSIKAFLQFKVNDINNIGFINLYIECHFTQTNTRPLNKIPFIPNSIATHLFNVSPCPKNKYSLYVGWPNHPELKYIIPVNCPEPTENVLTTLYTLNITVLNEKFFGNCYKDDLPQIGGEFVKEFQKFWNAMTIKELPMNHISMLIGTLFDLLDIYNEILDNWQVLLQLQTIILLMERIDPKKVMLMSSFQQKLHDRIASLAGSIEGKWMNTSFNEQIVKNKLNKEYNNTLDYYKNIVNELVKQKSSSKKNTVLDLNVVVEPIDESFQQPPQPSQEEIEARNIAATLQYEELMNKRQEDQWRQQRYQQEVWGRYYQYPQFFQQGEGGSSSQYQQFLHQGQGGGSHQYSLGYDPQYDHQYYQSQGVPQILPHGDVQPQQEEIPQQRRSRSRSSSRHRLDLNVATKSNSEGSANQPQPRPRRPGKQLDINATPSNSSSSNGKH